MDKMKSSLLSEDDFAFALEWRAQALRHWNSELYPEAERCFRQSMAHAEKATGAGGLLVGYLLSELSRLRCLQEQNAEALELAVRALRIAECHHEPENTLVRDFLRPLANAYFQS